MIREMGEGEEIADAVGEDRYRSDVTGRACRCNAGDRTMSRYVGWASPFEEKHSYSCGYNGLKKREKETEKRQSRILRKNSIQNVQL